MNELVHIFLTVLYLRNLYIYIYIFWSFFLGLHPWHVEVPRLGAELEPKPWQHQILKTLSGAGDPICILMDTSRFLNLLNHSGNSDPPLIYIYQRATVD